METDCALDFLNGNEEVHIIVIVVVSGMELHRNATTLISFNVTSQKISSSADRIRIAHSLDRDVALHSTWALNTGVSPAGRRIFAGHDLHDDRSETELPDPSFLSLDTTIMIVWACYSSRSR